MTIKTIAHKRLVVGEKKQRFGFRKTILGLCGAILGSTLLMAEAANNAHTVHAAESDPNQAKSVQIDNSAVKEAAQTKTDAAKDNGTSTDASKASAKTSVEAKVNEVANTANGLNGKIDQNLAKKEVPQLNSSLKQNEQAEKAVADKSQDADKGATGKTVSTNATSTNEYSASASNLSKTSAASTSNGPAVNPNAKYANSVETVDNNKRGNRENTHSISQRRIINLRRIVKKSVFVPNAVVPSAGKITVNRGNFKDFFDQNGSAKDNYDQLTGIQTLTNGSWQSGNISFKGSIDVRNNFEIDGAINLGQITSNPWSGTGIADGIGFAFYKGKRNQVGGNAGALGIYGIENAFGWKVDTWFNDKQDMGDSDEGHQSPYGAFITTNKTGYGSIDQQSAKNLTKSIEDNKFHDVKLIYNANTKEFKIVLSTPDGDVPFSKTFDYDKTSPVYYFTIAASTGGLPTHQAFRIDSMTYSPIQKAIINYVDDTTGKTIASDSVTGNSEETIDYSTANKISGFQKNGYELVKDGFSKGTTYDDNDKVDQISDVHLIHGTTPFGPNNPHTPGTPINPNDQNGPKWPAKDNYSQDHTYTVSFSGPDGKQLADPKTQTSHWSRTAYVDKVTGEIKQNQSTPWTPDKPNYSNTNVPVINGYVANKTSKNGSPVSNILPGLKTEPNDITDTVTYKPVGKIIPVDSNGKPIPGAEQPEYSNNPNNPTEVTPYEKVPVLPGKTPRQAFVTSVNPTEDTKITYTENAPTSPSKALPTDKEALTHVTKNNFLDYFSLNGSATYDKNTGIVTLTPDDYGKVGNFSLKSKINMNTSFTLTGKVNLGSDPTRGGADGIGFAFHNGNTTDIGNMGGDLGIGGLQNARGFKLDTYKNDTDPMNTPYGTFVDTEAPGWWTKYVAGTPQALNKDDVNGQFHDFTVDYDGDKRTLTIKYTQTSGKILTWTSPEPIPKSNQAMAMIVSAATAGSKNLQQFEIINFDFKSAAAVNVKYVDTKGNQIAKGEVTYPNGANVNGAYDTTSLNIPNYTFIKMSDSDITGGTSLPASGTLKNPGNNGTVIYVYVAVGKIIPVDSNGKPIPGAEQPKYINDPKDTTKVAPNEKVPVLPGKTPRQTSVTPVNPAKDTYVIYDDNVSSSTHISQIPDADLTPNAQSRKVTFYDDSLHVAVPEGSNSNQLKSFELDGNTDETETDLLDKVNAQLDAHQTRDPNGNGSIDTYVLSDPNYAPLHNFTFTTDANADNAKLVIHVKHNIMTRNGGHTTGTDQDNHNIYAMTHIDNYYKLHVDVPDKYLSGKDKDIEVKFHRNYTYDPVANTYTYDNTWVSDNDKVFSNGQIALDSVSQLFHNDPYISHKNINHYTPDGNNLAEDGVAIKWINDSDTQGHYVIQTNDLINLNKAIVNSLNTPNPQSFSSSIAWKGQPVSGFDFHFKDDTNNPNAASKGTITIHVGGLVDSDINTTAAFDGNNVQSRLYGMIKEGNVPNTVSLANQRDSDGNWNIAQVPTDYQAHQNINSKPIDNPSDLGLTDHDVHRIFARTISVAVNGNDKQTTVQKVEFKRDAYADPALDHDNVKGVVYGDWHIVGGSAGYTDTHRTATTNVPHSNGQSKSPIVIINGMHIDGKPGYKLNIGNNNQLPNGQAYTVPQSIEIQADTDPSVIKQGVNLNYISQNQSVQIEYIDQNNNSVIPNSATLSFNGNTDQVISTITDNYNTKSLKQYIEDNAPKHWDIISGAIDSYKFKPNDQTVLQVIMNHHHDTIGSDGNIDGLNHKPKNPQDVYNDANENIWYINQDNNEPTYHAIARGIHFHRGGDYDEVARVITPKGNWTADTQAGESTHDQSLNDPLNDNAEFDNWIEAPINGYDTITQTYNRLSYITL